MQPSPNVRPRFIDWISTVPYLVLFGLTLCVSEVTHRIWYLVAGIRGMEHIYLNFLSFIWWLLRICNVRFEVERSDQIDPSQRYVIVSNHQSSFDIVIIGHALKAINPKFCAKQDLGQKRPGVSFPLRKTGHALINRDNPKQAIKAIRTYGELAQEQAASPSIFPEGTRARYGELQEFYPAGAVTLIKAASELPILPVAIDNSWQLMRFNMFPIPWGVTVNVRLCDPIARDIPPRDILTKTRSVIQATLTDWRT